MGVFAPWLVLSTACYSGVEQSVVCSSSAPNLYLGSPGGEAAPVPVPTAPLADVAPTTSA